jgi:uncharacterized protein with von Willebrand factor type A (vWA) domain
MKYNEARAGLDNRQQEFSNLKVFRDLLADTFYGYYLNDPEMKEQDDLPPEYRISQLLLSWMGQQPDSLAAKQMTTGSAPASIASSLYSWRAMLSDEAFDAIRRALEQLQQMQSEIDKRRRQEWKDASDDRNQDSMDNKQQPEEQEDDQQPQPDDQGTQEEQSGGEDGEDEDHQQQGGAGEGEDEGEDEQEAGGGGDSEDEQEQPQPQPQSTSEQMQQEYERKAQKVEDAINRMMNNPVTNGAMREAAKEARKKTENLAAMADAWGLEMGNMSVLDVSKIMELMDMNMDFINKLVDLIGRSEIASSSALQRVRESYIGNPTKINTTQDLSKVLPYERILLSSLAPRVLRTQQVLKWANQGLLGWVIEAEGVTQGSFVAYVDGSGSMTQGEKDIASKAIAFGLARVLHEDSFEQRAYVIKTFGTERDGFIEIDETSDLSEVAEWAGQSPHGGTEFNYCFEDCLETMKNLEERDIIGTDLVFITDGQASVSHENRKKWAQFQERTGSRMMLVLVTRSGSSEFMSTQKKELRDMADLVLDVNPQDFRSNPEKVIDQLIDVIAMPRKEDNGL